MWVDPDAEENLKRGRGGRDNTLRFLFKIDIQGLGFFDMVLTSQKDRVDIQLFCPEKKIRGNTPEIVSGLSIRCTCTAPAARPLSASVPGHCGDLRLLFEL